MRRFVDWLAPRYDDLVAQARARFVVQAWLLAWPFSLMWAAFYALAGNTVEVGLNLAVTVLGPLVLWRLRRDGRLVLWANVSMAAVLLIFGSGLLTQTPIDETNLGFLVVLPLLVGFVLGPRGSTLWSVVSAATSVVLVLLGNLGYSLSYVDPSPLFSKATNIVFASLMAWLCAARFHQLRRESVWGAQQASRAKNVFLATIGHEIRTPMNGVLGMTEVMLAEQRDPALKEQLEVIQRSGRLMVSLINDLLDLTRLEGGKLTLEARPFALDEVLTDVEQLWRGAARAADLTLSVSRAPGVSDWFEGDALRLRQVLGNLVGNAVKFTPRGEVRVKVEAVAGPAGARAPWVRFSVEDTGVGIAAEHLPRLFTAFEQADPSTTRRYGGSGLGLALCRQLTLLMGGHIEARSTVGAGSTFIVELPLAPVAAPVPVVSPPHGLPVAGPGLGAVLVVDDNAINLRVTSALVEKAGYRSLRAANGLEALTVVREEPLVAVLMDCHMPEMDGFEATRRIRGLEGPRAHVPIVALTASAAPEDVEACLRAGMNDVLAKPASLVELTRALGRVCAPHGG